MNDEKMMLIMKQREQLIEDDFISSLEDRKLEEIEHSDIIHAPKESTGVDDHTIKEHAKSRHVYETNLATRKYIDTWIKDNANGKVVLDLACGSGEMTRLAHSYNAKIAIGTDLAILTIKNNRSLRTENQTNLFYILDDCEDMSLPDNSVDVVICSGMLHHVDLDKTISEINRVLRPGGRVLAIEALKHNPVLALYRRLTPNARTHWESAHILGIQEARIINKTIPVKRIRYWQLFSILAAFTPSFIRSKALSLFDKIDKVVLRVPYLNRMAWIFTIELEKKLK